MPIPMSSAANGITMAQIGIGLADPDPDPWRAPDTAAIKPTNVNTRPPNRYSDEAIVRVTPSSHLENLGT
jgi:hypothetical protein